jgi:oligogalacturonide lyase
VSKGDQFPSESSVQIDERTGARVREVTNHPSIHHHPFFFVPAYDDAMRRLVFVSHRTGLPQLFAEQRDSGALVQLTDRPDLSEWSVYPSHDGRSVFFTAGSGGWHLDLDSLEETRLVDFSDRASAMRDKGMVGGAAMGTTALSRDDRWWAIAYKVGNQSELAVVDTASGKREVILRRDSIGHMQFCPDDPGLLFYAGPHNDRVWLINRDGGNNRRLYARDVAKNEWIVHETWIPRTRELSFVVWPHGIRAVHADTGARREVCGFNAWHASCSADGTKMVADTNHPDVGIQLFDPRIGRAGVEPPRRTVCFPGATNMGEHWKGPFPYANGPVEVYAPQHTHPHPSFSHDGRFIVFTSDRTGRAQVYEVEVP